MSSEIRYVFKTSENLTIHFLKTSKTLEHLKKHTKSWGTRIFRGRGCLAFLVSNVLGFLVSEIIGFLASKFLGLLVPKIIGFKVSELLGFKVLKFQRLNDPILPKTHIILFGRC